jgi:hypothetical protein
VNNSNGELKIKLINKKNNVPLKVSNFGVNKDYGNSNNKKIINLLKGKEK